jgi:hypothetical protein
MRSSEKRSERDGFCSEKRKRTSRTLSIGAAKDARAVVLQSFDAIL